jgi:hypothetical protein
MFMPEQRIKLMMKDRFYRELECVFSKFPKYHKKNLLGDFNARVGRKIFSNKQLGIRVCTKLVINMELEQ